MRWPIACTADPERYLSVRLQWDHGTPTPQYHTLPPNMPCCDVTTWWSHRKNHQVLTCDFLFLIMRLLTHFNWPYKVGRTSTTNNKYLQKNWGHLWKGQDPQALDLCKGFGLFHLTLLVLPRLALANTKFWPNISLHLLCHRSCFSLGR